MTREEFEAEILAGLGGRQASDETITVNGYNLVYKWLQRAMRMVTRKRKFRELIVENTALATVADSTTPIALPTNTKTTYSVRIIDGSNSWEVAYKSPLYIMQNFPNPAGDASGEPIYYTVMNKSLRFIPTPGEAYTLYCILEMWPAELAGDGSSPDFGEDLVDDVIIEYALGYGFASFGEKYKKDAEFHFSLGNSFLDDAFTADNYVGASAPTPMGYHPETRLRETSIPEGATTAHPFRR